MKFSAYLFLILVISFSKLYSQDTESYLISLSIKDDYANNKIESLNLPIIYLNDDKLITIISSEKLIELESFGINYSELDQCTSSDKFSILSSKKDYDWTSILGSEKIVYKGTNFVIVKNTSLKPEEASLNGFKIS